MQLTKSLWTKSDILPFQNYLLYLSKGKEKANFEKKIVNTTLPCIAVDSKKVKEIVSLIFKGNYISFLDLFIWENFTNTLIIGGIISKIKDFSVLDKYLNIYSIKADNWATCDTLKFKITDKNKLDFFNLGKKYILFNEPFRKRIGLIILLKLVSKKHYVKEILNIIDKIKTEHYYVQMAMSWIICEAFVKDRETTLTFLKTNNLDKFVINKAISKCRDSFRVSDFDKELLKSFKK